MADLHVPNISARCVQVWRCPRQASIDHRSFPAWHQSSVRPNTHSVDNASYFDCYRLAVNAVSSVITAIAAAMHRIARGRAPFTFTCAAAIVAWIAFFVDLAIFMRASSEMASKAGLVGKLGLALACVALAPILLTVGAFFSYSRSIKNQMNWPKQAPPEVGPVPAAGGGMSMGAPPMAGGSMGGAPPAF